MTSSDDPRGDNSIPPEPPQGGYAGQPPQPPPQWDTGYATAPPPPKANPPWLIWAIVGGATVLVVAVIVVAIVKLGSDGQNADTPQGAPGTSSAPARQTLAGPMEELRSHLPAALRSASECKEAAVGAYADAAIECVWLDSDVPTIAGYRIYAGADSMNADAEGFHQRQTQAQSCTSAEDFLAGGQDAWTTDGRSRGTVWCYLNDDNQPVVLWSDDALRILALAVGPAIESWEQLISWFRTEGGPE